jgi:hypothetical protein
MGKMYGNDGRKYLINNEFLMEIKIHLDMLNANCEFRNSFLRFSYRNESVLISNTGVVVYNGSVEDCSFSTA